MSDIPDAIAARAKAARIAEHQAALESLRQFGEPLAAPDPVIVIDMRLQAMVEVYDREWEEFDVEASVAFAASAARLRDAREAMVLRLEAEMPAATTKSALAAYQQKIYTAVREASAKAATDV